MKRQLIDQLLDANRPIDQIYATDYESTIVSKGPLYPNFDIVLDTRKTPHPRSKHSNTSAPAVESSITFLGLVNVSGLNKHVSSTAFLENPEYELQALNIISWKDTNSDRFQGGRVGKKFYPKSLINEEDEKKDKDKNLLLIRHGFFSSMRAGDGSILLNVNLATSAFYTAINLQTWMILRWTQHPNSKDFQRELRGVRVKVLLTKKKGEDIRIIRNISQHVTSGTTFFKDKDKKDKKLVSKYLKESKFKPVFSESRQ
jgi:hypothetical protein